MTAYPTPHNNATPEDFAQTVLMPGDPLRSAFIAENFLRDAKLVNNVRGIQGYTGYYKDTRVSVMASGMGMPSMGIYANELYSVFGVQNIIRVGSAGGMQSAIRVRDIVLGMGACTDSRFAYQYNLPGTFAPICSYAMLEQCVEIAKENNLRYHVGNLLSSDVFYQNEEGVPFDQTVCGRWNKMGVLAVEMESAALYMTAARHRKNALAICTVSDHLLTGEATDASERQTTFTDMMRLALETAVRMEKQA